MDAKDWLIEVFFPWLEFNLALDLVVEILQKVFKQGKG